MLHKAFDPKVEHTQTRGFDDLSWERSPPLAPLSISEKKKKDTMVRNENCSWKTDVWKHTCVTQQLSPLCPPCERAPAQISQLTAFNELLQPVHHTKWGRGGKEHLYILHSQTTTETSAAGPHQHHDWAELLFLAHLSFSLCSV